MAAPPSSYPPSRSAAIPGRSISSRGSQERQRGSRPSLLYEVAIRDTIERFEATGSPVVTDGETAEVPQFRRTACTGFPNRPDGFTISSRTVYAADGAAHGGRSAIAYADSFLEVAMRYAHAPLKQAVIAFLFEPDVTPREDSDYRASNSSGLVNEHETEIRAA